MDFVLFLGCSHGSILGSFHIHHLSSHLGMNSWQSRVWWITFPLFWIYFHDYNPEITQNPFAYFTQVIYYAFLRRIYKEEKNRYIIYKNFQETVGLTDSGHLVDTNDNDKHIVPKAMYDNINQFMDKFEKKEDEKKQKRKQIVKEGLDKFYKD